MQKQMSIIRYFYCSTILKQSENLLLIFGNGITKWHFTNYNFSSKPPQIIVQPQIFLRLYSTCLSFYNLFELQHLMHSEVLKGYSNRTRLSDTVQLLQPFSTKLLQPNTDHSKTSHDMTLLHNFKSCNVGIKSHQGAFAVIFLI